MRLKKKGFSLVELILVTLIIAVVAMIAVPRMNFSAIEKQRASVDAKKITALIRKTRSLAVLNAAANSSGYRLEMTGSEPYGEYEIKDLSSNKTIETGSISAQCTGASVFNFGPLGNRLSPNSEAISISDGQDSYLITVVNSTGMVKCVKN